MADERQLVLDANILIRAVLGRRVRQIIETHALHASFFAPDVAYADAAEHLEGIVRKRGGEDEAVAEAFVVLDGLRLNVQPVQLEVYESHRVDALSRIELRDSDDWPILAAALLSAARSGPRTRTSSVRECPRGPRTGSRSTSGPRSD